MSSRIITPFGFTSTAEEVTAGIDLTGKRALVTGGAGGIGLETSRVLASAGAEVTIAARRPDVAEEVATELRLSTGNPNINVLALDLAQPGSVRTVSESWSGPLHLLVNNAGIMAVPELELTPEGLEIQFATNYLGHFQLTLGLQKALAKAQGARVVNLSSTAHMMSPVLWDDINFSFIPYVPFVAYGQSKTAMALMSVELTRLWAEDGIFSNSLNPGAIQTGLQKHTGAMKTPVEKRKSVAQGAATTVLLATSPLLEGVGGKYFEDCREPELVTKRPTDFSGGFAAYALDPDNATRLWKMSLKLMS